MSSARKSLRRVGLRLVIASALMFGVAGQSCAAPNDGEDVGPAPDYTQTATWVCRPGAEERCTSNEDAVLLEPSGNLVPKPFEPAGDAPIDCFYVYPTVSLEDRDYADLNAGPMVVGTVHEQAGRLTSRCRVFAPIYRQATIARLRRRLVGRVGPESDLPYHDIVSAWNEYLQQDNHGRGVVLIGHSQGASILLRLMAEHIDGTPSQKLLVSAFLAGERSLGVPRGAVVGGTLAHIPLCRSAAQAGCVYAWGTYLEGDAASPLVFGAPRQDGLVSACVNPAAPDGGPGPLKSYFRAKDLNVDTQSTYVEVVEGLSAVCQTDAAGAGLRVSVPPGKNAAVLQAMLAATPHLRGWGLHNRDISMYLGNILDLIDLEATSWQLQQ